MPNLFWRILKYLVALDLSDHQLDGEIPVELGELSRLTELDLSEDQLDGEIPAELREIYQLNRVGPQ